MIAPRLITDDGLCMTVFKRHMQTQQQLRSTTRAAHLVVAFQGDVIHAAAQHHLDSQQRITFGTDALEVTGHVKLVIEQPLVIHRPTWTQEVITYPFVADKQLVLT